jgi:hypothetical protein
MAVPRATEPGGSDMVRRCCAFLSALMCVFATAAGAVDTRVPAGTVLMRCGPVDEFRVSQTVTMKVAGQPEQLLFESAMVGAVVQEGADLRSLSTYVEANSVTATRLGPFLLDILFSDIGEPLSVSVRKLDQGTANMPPPGSAAYDEFVNRMEVAMAMVTLPMEAVGMGDPVYDLAPLFRASFTADQLDSVQFVSNDLASTVAGEVEIGGRRFVVVQHSGSIVFDMSGQRMRARASGYWTVDRENCDPGDGVLKFVMTLTANEDMPIMVFDSVIDAE